MGLPPGSVVYVGKELNFSPVWSYWHYNSHRLAEIVVSTDNLPMPPKKEEVGWLGLIGLHQPDTITALGAHLGMHALLLEDFANTTQRPKVEEDQDVLVLILKSFVFDKKQLELTTRQVNLVLKSCQVVSLCEDQIDSLSHVLERLKAGRGLIRKRGADYLFFAMLDVIVDSYYEVMDEIVPLIEQMESAMMHRHAPDFLHKLQRISRVLFTMRKHVLPLREAVSKIQRGDFEQIHADHLRYFGDVNDHLMSILDNIDFYIQMTGSLKELYLSNISFKMNKVMQVLTAISAVFIPLTFLVGVYGMNFDFMPELHWKYGYFVLWGLMAAIGLALWIGFKRRKWL